MVAFLTIWDGWHGLNHLKSFINDASVLQKYIDNALVPLIKAIKDEPGFAGVEIINKMGDHILHGEANSERCFDTVHSLGLSAPGKYSIENVGRFISWQADAIRGVDPDILITAGFHDNGLLSDRDGFNYLKDECLLKAGGRPHNTGAMQQLGRPLVLQLATKVENKTADDVFRWVSEESYSGILYSHLRTQHSDFFPLLLPEQLDAINELQQTADQYKGGSLSFAVTKHMVCVKNTTRCLLPSW